MKRKEVLYRVAFVFAALAALVSMGCTSFPAPVAVATPSGRMEFSQSNEGQFGLHYKTPVKDFTAVGLVFTENTLTTSAEKIDGEIFTYQALLREAQRLGADAIINVVMDKRIDTYIPPPNRSGMNSNAGYEVSTWYGSALAISYTDVITETETVTVTTTDGVGADVTRTTTTTTKEATIFNEGGTPVSTGIVTGTQAARAQAPAAEPERELSLFERMAGGRK